ncbi:MAG TPA: hypothetical protein VNB90_09600 [Cytophagaceae bacterium]|jgi:hypothetical protein|nr:hypothetical protein [Cytophagaceae bacterium]
MKKVFFAMGLAFGLFSMGNALAQHPEAHKLDKQIEAAMDTATHNMMLFILKQDTSYYSTALSEVERAKSLTKQYQKLVAQEKGLSSKTDSEEAAYLVDEINMFYKPNLKQTVLNDKKKTEKYKYRGQNYMVGSKSKTLLDQFAAE